MRVLLEQLWMLICVCRVDPELSFQGKVFSHHEELMRRVIITQACIHVVDPGLLVSVYKAFIQSILLILYFLPHSI